MASWRDSTSVQAQSDLDGLLDAVLPAAQQLLDSHGEFYPFAAKVNSDGELAMLAAHTGDERPRSNELLDALSAGALSQLDSLRAVALVSDVRLPESSDAVRVELEHEDGVAMAVLLPYKKRRFGRGIKYGTLAAEPSEPRLWAKS